VLLSKDGLIVSVTMVSVFILICFYDHFGWKFFVTIKII